MGREGVVIGGKDYVLSQADALTKNAQSDINYGCI